MNFIEYKITEKFNNYSILDFFKYHKVSKKRIYEYTFKDMLKVNDEFVNINHILNEGDILYLFNKEEVDYLPYDKRLDIIYEDNHLLIINKPSDMIIHPDDKTKNNTLVNLVANYFIKNNIKSNVRFIHRLDYQTTGIIVFVKDFLTTSYYDYLLSENLIKRNYLAIVCGKVKKDKAIINKPIGKDRHNSKKRRVSSTGQEAITNYTVINRYKNCSLVELNLKTGRTHQIRVHMSHINHPLVGDDLYETKIKTSRVMLHSSSLEIKKPLTNDTLFLECHIPNDMKDFIKNNK